MEISPMLLSEVDDKTILERPGWIYQEKHNGIRSIIHVKGHKIVGIRGRSNNPLIYCFPEFRNIHFDFDTAILDAEITVMYEGKSIYYGGIDKRRSAPNDKTLKDYPATIMVFDIIQFEDRILIYKPYYERLHIIEQNILPTDRIRCIESTQNGKALWDKVVEENREGVTCKDPMGLYELGKRSSQTIKVKNYKYADVKVEKTEPNAKGTKIYAHTIIDDKEIVVECQRAGCFDINIGDIVRVKYLDIVGDHLVQPTNW